MGSLILGAISGEHPASNERIEPRRKRSFRVRSRFRERRCSPFASCVLSSRDRVDLACAEHPHASKFSRKSNEVHATLHRDSGVRSISRTSSRTSFQSLSQERMTPHRRRPAMRSPRRFRPSDRPRREIETDSRLGNLAQTTGLLGFAGARRSVERWRTLRSDRKRLPVR